MTARTLVAIALSLALPRPSGAQAAPRIPDADRVRIAEAFRLADALGDSVWPGWHSAPFAVLLVTPDAEFLVRHPHPSAQFTLVGYDSLLGGEVFTRARVFAPTMLATFPADAGVPTIVIGDAERTGKRSTAWVLTLLHEHFHQLQNSQPGYYDRAAALGLAHGDETGMWMLNYPFPYDTARVDSAVATLGRATIGAAQAKGAAARRAALRRYLDARRELRAMLPPDDYRYLAFQLWQEGVARYTELAMARLAARSYSPSAAFRALPDYDDFSVAAAEHSTEIGRAAGLDLGAERRVAFYPLGAATALLLDQAVPRWRRSYFAHPFDLDALFDGATRKPAASRTRTAAVPSRSTP